MAPLRPKQHKLVLGASPYSMSPTPHTKLSPKTPAATQVFRFLDLPKELRLRVYDFVFGYPYRAIHLLACEKLYNNTATSCYNRSKGTHSAPGVLLLCRQTHEEALGLFYQRTLFVIHVTGHTPAYKHLASHSGIYLGNIDKTTTVRSAKHVFMTLSIQPDEYIATLATRLRKLLALLDHGVSLSSLAVSLECARKAAPSHNSESIMRILESITSGGNTKSTRNSCALAYFPDERIEQWRQTLERNGRAIPRLAEINIG